MKQSELAKGICSTSYLSKIETDSLLPSEEIKKLLLKKLGHLSEYQLEMSNVTGEGKLKEFYTYLLEKDIDNAHFLFNELSKLELSEHLVLKLKILTVHYYIEIKNFGDIPKIIQFIFTQETRMSPELRYLFYKVLGFYYYHVNNFVRSNSFLEKAVNMVSSLVLEDLELGTLYYAFSLSASRIQKTDICIKYCHLSLTFYHKLYKNKRCVDCHVLLGISYRRKGDVDQAINHYNTALNIAAQINYNSILVTIQHNLGYLYGIIGKSNEAISLFRKILIEESKLSPYEQVQSILSLIQELYKIDNINEINYWLEKGSSVLVEHPELKKHFDLEYEFYRLLISNSFTELEKIMFSKLIPILESENKLIRISDYCSYLGEYYISQKKYKNAAKYFSYSSSSLKKQFLTNKGANL